MTPSPSFLKQKNTKVFFSLACAAPNIYTDFYFTPQDLFYFLHFFLYAMLFSISAHLLFLIAVHWYHHLPHLQLEGDPDTRDVM